MDTEDVVPENIGNTGAVLHPNIPACPILYAALTKPNTEPDTESIKISVPLLPT